MTYEEKLTEKLNTYTKEDLINLYLQMRFERDLYLDMYSETQRWHNTIEEKPTEEKQYLCCTMLMEKPYFKVMRWGNNLYEIDKYDFSNCKGENGFYEYYSEYGYVKSDCDYWKPIDWYWEPIDWSGDNDYKDAIETLKREKPIHDTRKCGIELCEAVDTAIEALEKQIPASMDLEGDGYADGVMIYDTWICPRCGKHYELEFEYYDFCPNCGQALNWSDDNDE